MCTLNLTPEEKLCILFSRLKLKKQDINQILSLFGKNINWEYFFEQANHHRIAPLVYFHVIRQKIEEYIPEQHLILFKGSYNNHEIRNSCLFKDLGNLLKRLSDAKIKTVLLKGVSLIPELYKKLQIRPMSDCDLLIKRRDLKKTESILDSTGYSREKALNKILKRNVHSWERLKEIHDSGHLGFFKIQNLPYKNYQCIEMHISLFKRANLNFHDYTEHFSNKSVKGSFNGIQVYRLNPTDEFIYLCSHLFYNAVDLYSIYKNSDLRLLRFCDIREFLIKNKNIVLKLKLLPDSIKRAVIFTLQAIFLIYEERYFSEIIDYSAIPEIILKRAYWKINNTEHFVEMDIPFMKRLFSLTPPRTIQPLFDKVNKKQIDMYFKKLGSINRMISNKKIMPCKQ